MALVSEAGFERHLADRQVALAQQLCRAIDPAPHYILVHRQTNGFSEQNFAMRDAQPGNVGDRLQRKIGPEVLLNKRQNLFQLVRR